MRNSARNHNKSHFRTRTSVLCGVVLALLSPEAWTQDQEFQISSEDMIAIRADQAWEGSEPDTVHFEGNFEMRVHDWFVKADRATLEGKMDSPERLVLQGSPVRMELSHTVNGRTEQVSGEAQEIVYDRQDELIYLNGSAQLTQGENVLQSNSIEYDVKANRFRAEGDTGVRIQVATEEVQDL